MTVWEYMVMRHTWEWDVFKCALVINGYRIMHPKAFYRMYTEVASHKLHSASCVREFG